MNKPVADVGLFNGTKSSYSRETHQMLKVMMDEAKLTNLQRKQIHEAIKSQGSLPTSLPNESRTSSAQRKNGQNAPKRSLKSGLKTYDQIKASGAYEVEHYLPPPVTKYGGSYERDKERLTNIMAFGEDVSLNKAKAKEKPAPREVSKVKEVDRFEELQLEIEDRRQFLETMTKLGKAGEYRNKIETEISQMIKEMEAIDRKRSQEDWRRLAEGS